MKPQWRKLNLTKKKTIKKKTTKKKSVSKKEMEKIKEDIKKDELKNQKIILDNYCEVLSKYNFHALAQSQNRVQKIYHRELQLKIEEIGFREVLWGNYDDSKTKTESEIEYYKSLNKILEIRIDELPLEIKKEIVKDFAEKWSGVHHLWNITYEKKTTQNNTTGRKKK